MAVKINAKLEISREWALRKLVFVYSQIQCGFYQSNGFLLLDHANRAPRLYKHKIIQLPTLILDAISEDNVLRDLLQKAVVGGNMLSKSDVSELDEYILNNCSRECNLLFEPVPTARISHFFTKKCNREFSKILEFLNIKEIDFSIHPSLFGTSSFNCMDGYRLFPRYDTGRIGMLSILIGNIVREIYKDQTWENYMSIQKFLVMQTEYGMNIPEYVGLTELVANKDIVDLAEESNENYIKLGFPKEQRPEIKGNMLYLGGREIILSVNEAKVIECLLSSKNNIVEYENLGDSIWGDAENYSLEGMAKYIERIRKKVKASGVNNQLIHTVRGKGYVLVD